MVMVGQHERLAQPALRTLGQRRVIAVVLGVAVAALLAVGLYAAFGAATTAKRGCIDVDFPGYVGAGRLHACGAAARSYCASAAAAAPSLRRPLEADCRRAGL